MITEVVIQDVKNACVEHACKVSFIQGTQRIMFNPGLNILWGPNGCGKSTLLTAIARLLHCEQGGRTVITNASMAKAFSSGRLADGILPVHDGQATTFCDPSAAVGLIGGMAGFDYDFLQQGAAGALFQGSAGESTFFKMRGALRAIARVEIPSIEWRIRESDPRFKEVEAFLAGTLPKGQPTVILDEPDRSLSMKAQAGLWYNLATNYCNDVQVIVASHSPLALNVPGAHYIEMAPGYLEECREVVRRFILPAG